MQTPSRRRLVVWIAVLSAVLLGASAYVYGPGLVGKIRKASFHGGEVVCGFQASLSTPRTTFKSGDSIPFTYTVMYVGDGEGEYVPIVDDDPWPDLDYLLPEMKSSSVHSRAVIIVFRLAGKKGKVEETFFNPTVSPPRREKVSMKPGDRHTQSFDLGKHLTPGKYEAAVLYWANTRGLIPGADKDLLTNKITFDVTP